MKRVLILGSTGMLGQAMSRAFREFSGDVVEFSRADGYVVDESLISGPSILGQSDLRDFDWIVNCLGVTKSHINPKSPDSVKQATLVNSVYPNLLAEKASLYGVKVLQVATDCVFSGAKGSYVESDLHDPLDVYGKTKSLGEADSDYVMHLRCSLVGPEAAGRSTLFFEWINNLDYESRIRGFTNHYWNGLTSDAFADIALKIIGNDLFKPGLHHLVPADSVSKFSLIQLLLRELGRDDVHVEAFEHEKKVDRTLATSNPAFNQSLFGAAGFQEPPSVAFMLEEQVSRFRE